MFLILNFLLCNSIGSILGFFCCTSTATAKESSTIECGIPDFLYSIFSAVLVVLFVYLLLDLVKNIFHHGLFTILTTACTSFWDVVYKTKLPLLCALSTFSLPRITRIHARNWDTTRTIILYRYVWTWNEMRIVVT